MSVNTNHDLLMKMPIEADDREHYNGAEFFPVWADKDADATHEDCEAGWSPDPSITPDPCEGDMWQSSIEADIPLHYCDKHLRQDCTEIDADEYLALCVATGLDYAG
jgi:hypothetical protein